jgi:transposase InsO family protein
LKAVTTDNGSEFRSEQLRQAVRRLGAEYRFIRAGRPQTIGCIERVQRTVLEECWRPTFARSMVPRYTALRRDLDDYLGYYNFERAHTDRRTPAAHQLSSSMVPGRCARDEAELSPKLVRCSH